VHGRAGDLVSEDLDDHLRLNPHAGLNIALDARGLPLTNVWLAALSHLAPLGVAQAGSDLGDGRKDVALGVVGGHEECANTERGPPSPAVDVADDDAVNGILEVARLRTLELDPVVVAGPGLVGRVGPFGDDALQAALDGIIEHLEQLLRFAGRMGFGDKDGIPRFDRIFEHGVPLGVRSLHDTLALGVEDVEGEKPQGQLGSGLLDAVFASPPDGLLEWHIFIGERIIRDRLTLEDRRADDDLAPRGLGDLGEGGGHVLEVAGEDLDVVTGLVHLAPETVILPLDRRPPELRNDRLRARQPLGERGAHGVADADAEAVYRLYAALPQRLSYEPEVGGLVVRALEPLPEALVTGPGEGERVEHGRIAHSQAHPPQGYATQVIARQRIELP
jgi:hypothetical protein